MWHVYVLYSLTGSKSYVGYTNDIQRRLLEHNVSEVRGFTLRYRPWILIHTESYGDRESAIAREKFFKTGRGREEIKLFISNYLNSGAVSAAAEKDWKFLCRRFPQVFGAAPHHKLTHQVAVNPRLSIFMGLLVSQIGVPNHPLFVDRLCKVGSFYNSNCKWYNFYLSRLRQYFLHHAPATPWYKDNDQYFSYWCVRLQAYWRNKDRVYDQGTYADYVIQVNKERHFLVEVKALSFDLSEKHLRQTINYGANEGIEYALLTNGKEIEFYKILFDKPIDARRIFSIDLSDSSNFKNATDYLQHLHRESTIKYF